MTTQQQTNHIPGLPAPIARMRTGLVKDEILMLIVRLRENGGLPNGVKPDESWVNTPAVGWYLRSTQCPLEDFYPSIMEGIELDEGEDER